MTKGQCQCPWFCCDAGVGSRKEEERSIVHFWCYFKMTIILNLVHENFKGALACVVCSCSSNLFDCWHCFVFSLQCACSSADAATCVATDYLSNRRMIVVIACGIDDSVRLIAKSAAYNWNNRFFALLSKKWWQLIRVFTSENLLVMKECATRLTFLLSAWELWTFRRNAA